MEIYGLSRVLSDGTPTAISLRKSDWRGAGSKERMAMRDRLKLINGGKSRSLEWNMPMLKTTAWIFVFFGITLGSLLLVA